MLLSLARNAFALRFFNAKWKGLVAQGSVYYAHPLGIEPCKLCPIVLFYTRLRLQLRRLPNCVQPKAASLVYNPPGRTLPQWKKYTCTTSDMARSLIFNAFLSPPIPQFFSFTLNSLVQINFT
jgi:hypothetical protein